HTNCQQHCHHEKFSRNHEHPELCALLSIIRVVLLPSYRKFPRIHGHILPSRQCGVLPTYRVARHNSSVFATGRRAGPRNTNRGCGLGDYNETGRRCRGLISTWRTTMRKCAHLAVGALMSVALLLNGCAADTEQAAKTAETSVQTLIETHDLA